MVDQIHNVISPNDLLNDKVIIDKNINYLHYFSFIDVFYNQDNLISIYIIYQSVLHYIYDSPILCILAYIFYYNICFDYYLQKSELLNSIYF